LVISNIAGEGNNSYFHSFPSNATKAIIFKIL
jgi:hypothetical protein